MQALGVQAFVILARVSSCPDYLTQKQALRS